MEIMQMITTVPPQETPIDLTKSSDNLTMGYVGLTPEACRTAYPHLRFNGISEPKTQEIQKNRQSPGMQCTPHPKKRKFTDTEDQPKKKHKTNDLPQNHIYDLIQNFRDPNVWTNWSKYPYASIHPIAVPPERSVPDPDSLLAAVQHSQMLYYSYCSQLLQTLHTNRFLQNQSNERLKIYEDIQKQNVMPHSSWQPPQLTSPKSQAKEEPKSSTIRLPKEPTESKSPDSKSSLDVSCSIEDKLNHSFPDDSVGILGRRRAPRALTGKHVRPGTGASPTTLLTLRQKLTEKKKSKDTTKNHERKPHNSKRK